MIPGEEIHEFCEHGVRWERRCLSCMMAALPVPKQDSQQTSQQATHAALVTRLLAARRFIPTTRDGLDAIDAIQESAKALGWKTW